MQRAVAKAVLLIIVSFNSPRIRLMPTPLFSLKNITELVAYPLRVLMLSLPWSF